MKIIVDKPFRLQTDNGEWRHFGPGETIPDDLAGHWYIQQQVAWGNAHEDEAATRKAEREAKKAEAEAEAARKEAEDRVAAEAEAARLTAEAETARRADDESKAAEAEQKAATKKPFAKG